MDCKHARGWHSSPRPDLAPLSRLTRLDVLKFGDMTNRIPRLALRAPSRTVAAGRTPALKTFVGITSDLQILSSVTATLETLQLWAEKFDFRQPTTLSCFTRLRSLQYGFKGVRNLHPDVFSPTLRHVAMTAYDGPLIFPAGGQLCFCEDKIIWTRHAPE